RASPSRASASFRASASTWRPRAECFLDRVEFRLQLERTPLATIMEQYGSLLKELDGLPWSRMLEGLVLRGCRRADIPETARRGAGRHHPCRMTTPSRSS